MIKEKEKQQKTQKPTLPRRACLPKSIMLKNEEVIHNWLILDAAGKTLGRFAAEIAKILRGKHKPAFTPHADCGDGVIVINAEKIEVTGAKKKQKIYRYYTGFMGGMRETVYETLAARNPSFIIEKAVSGMLPKTRLANAQAKRLRVFAGEKHDMEAQKPIKVNI